MSNLKKLDFLIISIIIRVVLDTLFSFDLIEYPVIKEFFGYSFLLLNALIFCGLFYFIKYYKSVQISFFMFVLWMVGLLYSLIFNIIPLPELEPSTTVNESMFRQVLQYSVPATLSLLSTVVIAIQLIKNKSIDKEKEIRLVGYTYLIDKVFLFLFPVFMGLWVFLVPEWVIPIWVNNLLVFVLGLLVNLSLLNLYVRERIELQSH